jgi:hypothetical protein
MQSNANFIDLTEEAMESPNSKISRLYNEDAYHLECSRLIRLEISAIERKFLIICYVVLI